MVFFEKYFLVLVQPEFRVQRTTGKNSHRQVLQNYQSELYILPAGCTLIVTGFVLKIEQTEGVSNASRFDHGKILVTYLELPSSR